MQYVFTWVITKGHQIITTAASLQSLRVLSKVLILILGTIIIPFIFALTLSILLTFVFAIAGIFLCLRSLAKLFTGPLWESYISDMKMPTFYAKEEHKVKLSCVICMTVIGVVFGGIHCVGWFFNFPSSVEAMLWRVSSVVLTGIAFLFPMLSAFGATLFGDPIIRTDPWQYFTIAVSSIFLVVYVVSRLLLLVEAFISLRRLNPRNARIS